jgi:hypothetical protein
MSTPIEFFVLTRVAMYATKGTHTCLCASQDMTMKLVVDQIKNLKASVFALFLADKMKVEARRQYVELLKKDRDLSRNVGKREWEPVFMETWPRIFISQQALDAYLLNEQTDPGCESNFDLMRQALWENYVDANALTLQQ